MSLEASAIIMVKEVRGIKTIYVSIASKLKIYNKLQGRVSNVRTVVTKACMHIMLL